MDKKDKEKIMDVSSVEVGEDTTKYGEFMSSYFAWMNLEEQKKNAERLGEITDKE